MKFLSRFAVVAALLVLPACAQFTAMKDAIETGIATKITQKEAYLAASGFDVAEISGTNYLRLPICTPATAPICREPSMTPTIKAALLSGRSSRNNIKAYLRSHQADGENAAMPATEDFNLMTAATKTIDAVTSAYKAAMAARS